jgi:hypothetical protein
MQREHAQIMKITNVFFNPISAFAQTNLIIELKFTVYLFSKKLGTVKTLRDQPFNLQVGGGVMVFASFRKFFPDNMRVIIFIFFVAQSTIFFLQNLTLGYKNDRFRCCPYCYNSFNFFSRSDAAEEKLAQTSSYLQDCLSKQLFIEKHKVTGQNVDIYTFQMILQFVVKAFEEESSLLLPEVYDRYKLLLHKNDLNIVIDTMTVTKIIYVQIVTLHSIDI